MSTTAKAVNNQLKKYDDSFLCVVKIIMAIVLNRMPMVSRTTETYPINTQPNTYHVTSGFLCTFMIYAWHYKTPSWTTYYCKFKTVK